MGCKYCNRSINVQKRLFDVINDYLINYYN